MEVSLCSLVLAAENHMQPPVGQQFGGKACIWSGVCIYMQDRGWGTLGNPPHDSLPL